MTPEELDHDPDVAFANKLHQFTVFLGLTPYKKSGIIKQKISQISQSSIHSVQVICPPNMSCTTATCNPYHIALFTRYRDVPNVTLIEGTSIITNTISLAGECTKCKTHYHALRITKTINLLVEISHRNVLSTLLVISRLDLI